MTNDEILAEYAVLVRLRLSQQIKRLRKIKAEYDAEVEDWYTNGDGQSPNWVDEWDEELQEVIHYNAGGKGYRFPHCIHGASLWTDYDNICGGCEDGYLTGGSVAPIAYEQAKSDVIAFVRRTEWLDSAPWGLPDEIKASIAKWSVEVFA